MSNKLQEKLPMGVSQWKEHGIKYGYWNYFEGKFTKGERDFIIIVLSIMLGASLAINYYYHIILEVLK
jgi:hypothetical protein